MIAFLHGIVADFGVEASASYLVLEVNQVGYRVFVSNDTLSRVAGVGTEVTLYTYLVVKEDELSLYGFLNRSELALFKQIIMVNGIGPKGGLAILSVMTPEAFRFAIRIGDVKGICAAPGIGKKIAERLILELKDKLSDTVEEVAIPAAIDKISAGGENFESALSALTSLGYSSQEAGKALKSIPDLENMDLQDVLEEAFKKLL